MWKVYKCQRSERYREKKNVSPEPDDSAVLMNFYLAAVVGCIRPAQNQTNQHSGVHVRIHPPILLKKLLTADDFLGKKNQFSLKLWFLVDQSYPN